MVSPELSISFKSSAVDYKSTSQEIPGIDRQGHTFSPIVKQANQRLDNAYNSLFFGYRKTVEVFKSIMADQSLNLEEKVSIANKFEQITTNQESKLGWLTQTIDKFVRILFGSTIEEDGHNLIDIVRLQHEQSKTMSSNSQAEVSSTQVSSISPSTIQTSDAFEQQTPISLIFDNDTPDIRPNVPSNFVQQFSNPSIATLAQSPACWGNLSRNQSEDALDNATNKSWLLRTPTSPEPDIQPGSLVRTTKLDQEQFKHETIVEPPSTKSLESIQTDSKGLIPKSRYDRQLHLNLGSGRSAQALTHKATGKDLPTSTVDLRSNNPAELNTEIQQLTHDSRVYIIGHCDKGSSHISSDEHKAVSAKDFADMLAQNPNLKKEDDGKRIKVSVLACYGGKDGLDGQESFSAQLSQELAKRGIPADIMGRTETVGRATNSEAAGTVTYGKRIGSTGRHHHTGDKVAFFTDKNGETKTRTIDYKTVKKEANDAKESQVVEAPVNSETAETNNQIDSHHGKISRDESERLLQNQGDYLVRDSSIKGFEVLSVKSSATKHSHTLFKEEQGGIQPYHVESGSPKKSGSSYSNIEGFIKAQNGQSPVANSQTNTIASPTNPVSSSKEGEVELTKAESEVETPPPINHGKISRPASEHLLQNQGDYLVRDSSVKGFEVLSAKSGAATFKHLLFKEENGGIQPYSMAAGSSSPEKAKSTYSNLEQFAKAAGGNNPILPTSTISGAPAA
jgi:hypothetical protein